MPHLGPTSTYSMIPSSAQLSNLTANNRAAAPTTAMVSPSGGEATAPPPPPPPPPGDAGSGSGSGGSGVHPTHVSETAYEFLLGSVLHWVETECSAERIERQKKERQQQEAEGDEKKEEGGGGSGTGPTQEELAILSAERAAAKIERMGFDVGYRFCERLAQSKPLGPGLPPPGSSAAAAAAGGGGSGGAGAPPAVDPAAMQLEAVKFLCKEFWTEVFRKQIDKLQTNHRGVFVLKDHELRWLRRLPPEDETARVAAIKMLAFPCGLIRGALSNLGIAAVVSCDFLADGENMAACSFNIKIKS